MPSVMNLVAPLMAPESPWSLYGYLVYNVEEVISIFSACSVIEVLTFSFSLILFTSTSDE